jgi:cold-inducible RNA-binding protein
VATKTLFVGNLAFGVTEEALRELVADFGPLGAVRVIEGKGFAFVDIPEEKLAEAIEGLNGRDFEGRPLRVDEARPRKERGEGGRGFGGGRRGGRRSGEDHEEGPRW